MLLVRHPGAAQLQLLREGREQRGEERCREAEEGRAQLARRARAGGGRLSRIPSPRPFPEGRTAAAPLPHFGGLEKDPLEGRRMRIQLNSKPSRLKFNICGKAQAQKASREFLEVGGQLRPKRKRGSSGG